MANYTLDTTLGTLLADPKAKTVLDKYIPGLSSNPMVAMVSGASLKALVGMPQAAQMGLTEAKVKSVLDEINKLA
jgi:hypothetical protein